MTKKKPEPNPIEEAIGDRAKTSKDIPKIVDKEKFKKLAAEQIHDEPSPLEMLTLEELNRQTEERLLDRQEEETQFQNQSQPMPKPIIPPASRLGLLPVTKISSQESPPQKIDEIDEYQDAEKSEKTMAESLGQKMNEAQKGVAPTVSTVKEMIEEPPEIFKPAEDIELTALRKYILEDGFVLATVAFHIVSLCAQPMTTPSTTMWDFKDRAMIPEMVLALLNQPGYLEGIWPSLRIVMSSNKGNAAWSAGIATTIAFFDVIRTLPTIEELKNV